MRASRDLLAGSVSKTVVAGVALGADRAAIACDMAAVVAAEAPVRGGVPQGVEGDAPRHFHCRKDVGPVQLLRRRDGLCQGRLVSGRLMAGAQLRVDGCQRGSLV